MSESNQVTSVGICADAFTANKYHITILEPSRAYADYIVVHNYTIEQSDCVKLITFNSERSFQTLKTLVSALKVNHKFTKQQETELLSLKLDKVG